MPQQISDVLVSLVLFLGLVGPGVLVVFGARVRQQLGFAGVLVLCLFVFAMLPLLFGIGYMAAYGLQYVGIIFFVTGFLGVFADAGLLLWCLKNRRAFAPKDGKAAE